MPIYRVKCEYEVSMLGNVDLIGDFVVNDDQIEDEDIIEQIIEADENQLIQWRENKKFANFSAVEVAE